MRFERNRCVIRISFSRQTGSKFFPLYGHVTFRGKKFMFVRKTMFVNNIFNLQRTDGELVRHWDPFPWALTANWFALIRSLSYSDILRSKDYRIRVVSLALNRKKTWPPVPIVSGVLNLLFHRFFRDFFHQIDRFLSKMAAEVKMCKVGPLSYPFLLDK